MINLQKIKSLRDFAGVPKGTTGTLEKDGDLFKITWNGISNFRGSPYVLRPVEDWFNQGEVDQFLEILN